MLTRCAGLHHACCLARQGPGACTANATAHRVSCSTVQADRLPDEVVQNAKAALRWLGRPCWPRPPAGQAEGGGDRGEPEEVPASPC